MLRARSHTYDVISMDIIWPAAFGANGWTVPISESQWPQSERQKYLQAPIQGCTYNGKLWAVPHSSEPGMLFYRKGLISTPPGSWEDLTRMAKSVSPSKTKFGYVWQGAQYEGLVCDFIEVLYSYGGSVLDSNDSKKVTVNSPEAVQALTEMVSWVGSISPDAVTTYKEEDARSTWQNGDAAFMRNWTYAYTLGNDPANSKIAGKFDISPLLPGGSNKTGYSCIGGWQLGMNAFSSNQEAAWKFIQYMISEPAQKFVTINESIFTTLKSIPGDPDVVAKIPFIGKVSEALQNGKARPTTPVYPDVTNAIQLRIHQALTRQTSPAAALSALQSDLQAIVSK